MDNFLLTGLWQAGNGTRYVWYGAPWADFRAKADQLKTDGYLLNSLDVAQAAAGPVWAGVWVAKTDPRQELLAGLSLAELVTHSTAVATNGLQLTRLRSYEDNGTIYWSGVWSNEAVPTVTLGPMSYDDFLGAWLDQHAAGRRLLDFDVQEANGNMRWTGIWQPGAGEQYLWAGASWSALAAKHNSLRADGYQLHAVLSYLDRSARSWAAVWRTALPNSSMVADLQEDQFWTEWDRQLQHGLRLSRIHLWPGSGYAGAQPGAARIRLHLKILANPTIPVAQMVERMREVYEPAGFQVEVGSVETLEDNGQLDVDVGVCTMSAITPEQHRLFRERNNVTDRDVVAYFVRSTLPPFNGCAAYPAGCPGVVIASYASQWTLGHEIGHVLGLFHVADNQRLMTGLGTDNIINPPPDLIRSEIETMAGSGFVHPAN